jgi:hypothetical protein
MSTFRPVTPDLLRAFLRDRLTPERLRDIASSDYDRDGDGIAQEFTHNLNTGEYSYSGEGNPYECAMMQGFDTSSDSPLNALFGAWWIGTFCSDPENFVLIDNLGLYGVDELLYMVVRGCGELGDDAAKAAHAAIPFVLFLRARTPFAEEARFDGAIADLEAIEQLGSAGGETTRKRDVEGPGE